MPESNSGAEPMTYFAKEKPAWQKMHQEILYRYLHDENSLPEIFNIRQSILKDGKKHIFTTTQEVKEALKEFDHPSATNRYSFADTRLGNELEKVGFDKTQFKSMPTSVILMLEAAVFSATTEMLTSTVNKAYDPYFSNPNEAPYAVPDQIKFLDSLTYSALNPVHSVMTKIQDANTAYRYTPTTKPQQRQFSLLSKIVSNILMQSTEMDATQRLELIESRSQFLRANEKSANSFSVIKPDGVVLDGIRYVNPANKGKDPKDVKVYMFAPGVGNAMEYNLKQSKKYADANGMDFVLVNYTGVGLSTGKNAGDLNGEAEDLKAAMRCMEDNMGYKPTNMLVLGNSKGAYTALAAVSSYYENGEQNGPKLISDRGYKSIGAIFAGDPTNYLKEVPVVGNFLYRIIPKPMANFLGGLLQPLIDTEMRRGNSQNNVIEMLNKIPVANRAVIYTEGDPVVGKGLLGRHLNQDLKKENSKERAAYVENKQEANAGREGKTKFDAELASAELALKAAEGKLQIARKEFNKVALKYDDATREDKKILYDNLAKEVKTKEIALESLEDKREDELNRLGKFDQLREKGDNLYKLMPNVIREDKKYDPVKENWHIKGGQRDAFDHQYFRAMDSLMDKLAKDLFVNDAIVAPANESSLATPVTSENISSTSKTFQSLVGPKMNEFLVAAKKSQPATPHVSAPPITMPQPTMEKSHALSKFNNLEKSLNLLEKYFNIYVQENKSAIGLKSKKADFCAEAVLLIGDLKASLKTNAQDLPNDIKQMENLILLLAIKHEAVLENDSVRKVKTLAGNVIGRNKILSNMEIGSNSDAGYKEMQRLGRIGTLIEKQMSSDVKTDFANIKGSANKENKWSAILNNFVKKPEINALIHKDVELTEVSPKPQR